MHQSIKDPLVPQDFKDFLMRTDEENYCAMERYLKEWVSAQLGQEAWFQDSQVVAEGYKFTMPLWMDWLLRRSQCRGGMDVYEAMDLLEVIHGIPS